MNEMNELTEKEMYTRRRKSLFIFITFVYVSFSFPLNHFDNSEDSDSSCYLLLLPWKWGKELIMLEGQETLRIQAQLAEKKMFCLHYLIEIAIDFPLSSH
jgi:hypothetical protein